MEHQWNYNCDEKAMYLEKILPQCPFVPHISHMECFRFEHKPPWSEDIYLPGLFQRLLSGKYKFYVKFTGSTFCRDINIQSYTITSLFNFSAHFWNLLEEISLEYLCSPSSCSSSDSGASPATIIPCGLFGPECFVFKLLTCNYIKTFVKKV